MNSIFTFRNLYDAYLDCRKRKRNTINAIRFEADLESNLFSLLNELKQRIYAPGTSICFAVDKPVIREIFAADFRDRIIHHLFIRTIESHFEKYFIYDNYACRQGKGTLFGVRRLQKFVRCVQNLEPKNYNNWHYLKADISGFFMHIIHKDKEKLKEFHDAINGFLKENLFLEFNLKKCYIQPLSYGIDFIGYFVKPWRMYARRRVAKAFKDKLWIFEKYGKSDEDKDKIKKSIASYFGHFKHAKSFRFLEKIKEKHPWIKQTNPKAFSVLS